MNGGSRDIHVALYLYRDCKSMRQSSSAPMETPLLKSGAERGYGGEGGDYPPLTSWREVRSMLWRETVKVWRVAGPLAFQILCQFGTNLVTTVFVGHIGNLELSAVSISVSVIGTFSFGFMVGFLFSLYTSILSRVFPFWVVTVIYEVCGSFSYLCLCLVAEKRWKRKKKKDFDFLALTFEPARLLGYFFKYI